jgi:hypothetical protein
MSSINVSSALVTMARKAPAIVTAPRTEASCRASRLPSIKPTEHPTAPGRSHPVAVISGVIHSAGMAPGGAHSTMSTPACNVLPAVGLISCPLTCHGWVPETEPDSL